ncbi:MAG: YncE family protein [Solirubrobacterales bacterium]
MTHAAGAMNATWGLDSARFGRRARLLVLLTLAALGLLAAANPAQSLATQAGCTGYVSAELGFDLTVIDLGTDTEVTSVPAPPPPDLHVIRDVVSSPSGKVFALVENSQASQARLYEFNTATNTFSTSFAVIPQNPTSFVISPDGNTAYVATTVDPAFPIGGSVTVVDLASLTTTATISVPAFTGAADVDITPDGQTLFVANQFVGVFPIDVATQTVGTLIPVPGGADVIKINPAGTLAYVAVNDAATAYVQLLDPVTRTLGGTITGFQQILGLAFTPDGNKAYVTDINAGNVTPINVATSTKGTPIPAPRAWGIEVTPDGSTAYAVLDTVLGPSGGVLPINVATDTAGTLIPQVSDSPTQIAIVCKPVVAPPGTPPPPATTPPATTPAAPPNPPKPPKPNQAKPKNLQLVFSRCADKKKPPVFTGRATSRRASAEINGPTGCQNKPFNVSVTGKDIDTVTFTLDGKKLATDKKAPYAVKIDPGKLKTGPHQVGAKVTFEKNA